MKSISHSAIHVPEDGFAVLLNRFLDSRKRKALIVFLVGLTIAAVIISSNPIIYGGDTITRLVFRDRLVIGHWLPMLQVLIFAVTKISTDPRLVRYLVALIGASAGVGFYWVVEDLFGEKWAFPAALLFVSNPLFVVTSTVPYQESLMLAGLLFAFHFFYKERWLISSLFLGIACLTRYEAWAAGPVLAVTYIVRKDRSFVGWLKAGLLFGWMPVLWILANRGLSPPGHYVAESSFSIWRLQRYVHLSWDAAKHTQLPVLVLAAVGAWRLYADRSSINWRLWVQGAFVGIFLIAIPFSAHGVPPDPERYLVTREAYILVYFVLLFAALGLSQWPRWTGSVVVLSVVLGAAEAYWSVWRATHRPEVQLSYRLARYLDGSVHDSQRVLLLAKPIEEEVVQSYLDKVRQTSGEEALRKARLEFQDLGAMEGPDYKRVLAHSRLGRDQLLSSPAGCAQWIAVWSDYPDATRELATGQQVEVLRSGSMSVTILRRACGDE
jgi:hypothetical protein